MKKTMWNWRSPAMLALALGLPLAMFGYYASQRQSPKMPDTEPTVARNRTQEIGGIVRPLSDIGVQPISRTPNQEVRSGTKYERVLGEVTCPKTPIMKEGVNPQMDSVIAALKNKDHGERLSPYMKPTPFDAEAWGKDPSGYLSVAEPGRAFDVAQPSEGVPPLTNSSSLYNELKEGETVRLQAKTTPKAPVTFTLFGNGKFDNGIGTVTVAADDSGTATAVYYGSTAARAEVVAGSPTASGTLRFALNIKPPSL